MHILLILLTATSLAMAAGDTDHDLVKGRALCAHCPQPMPWKISDYILRQALAGLVPDRGPNYIFVRTISGESTADHIYGDVYKIVAAFREAGSRTVQNCRVDIMPGKKIRAQSVWGRPQEYYGEVAFNCGGSKHKVIKKMRGTIVYPS